MAGKKYYRSGSHDILYSSDNKQHIFGTGFTVNKRITSIDFKPTDRRMVRLESEVNVKTVAFLYPCSSGGNKRMREGSVL